LLYHAFAADSEAMMCVLPSPIALLIGRCMSDTTPLLVSQSTTVVCDVAQSGCSSCYPIG
jgi:hypothetical protein